MIDEAIQLLKENKLKITKQRTELLKYLSNFQHSYVDITQVDDYMREIFPGLSHNTIYRNIRDFKRVGIIEMQQRATGACVKYQCDFGHIHHHHFICKKCGNVTEIPDCSFENKIMQNLPGYQVDGHRFEVYGTCSECLAKEKIN